jgi:hypothetical protein
MAARPWTVTPHEPIRKHEDNLWSVASPVPGLGEGINRRMAIVKLSDGKLLFYNAIPLTEEALAEVRGFGQPAYLIVPHNAHTIDAEAFRLKLGLTVYAPRVDVKVGSKVQVDHGISEVPKDPAIDCRPVAGAKLGEPLLLIHSGPDRGRTTLFFSDALMNSKNSPGLRGTLFRWLGFTGDDGPRVSGPWKLLFLSDKEALKRDYQAWMQTPGLVRIMPSHGEILEGTRDELVAALQHSVGTL